jgi:hypothetical protein
MAVTDISNSQLTFTTLPIGVQVTKVTDTSADWASVANNTYFYDKGDQLVHYKNSGGSVLELFSAAGGLTYFTEAQSTAYPNATVNVDSLTAVASTANADFVIKPKGTGALITDIPDGTGSGGAKRGIAAIDLQLTIVGSEGIEWMPISKLNKRGSYSEEKDFQFYETPKLSYGKINNMKGSFCILFPEDGHMPQLIVDDNTFVKKLVVKIPTNSLKINYDKNI